MRNGKMPRSLALAAIATLLVIQGATAGAESTEPRNRPGSVLADAVAKTCPVPQGGASFCHRCLQVETEFAVIKDLKGQEQLLLVARRDVTGIESSLLQEPWAFNYWGAAWEARRFMAAVPDDDISLAINSRRARGIDRLHIHLDRPNPEVKKRLKELGPTLTMEWGQKFNLPPRGYPFWVRKIASDDIVAKNLFTMLPLGMPGADPNPASYALIVVGGAPLDGGRTGLFLIAGQDRDLGGAAWSEQLQQDHGAPCTCN